jgi:putative hydrolase of the HAD superfamily
VPDLMVVFDVDDTLYLERDYVRSGFKALDSVVLEQFGTAGFGTLAWSNFLRGCRGNTFDITLSQLGVEFVASDVAALVDAYRSHSPAISLLPDAEAAINDLSATGISIGVLTDGPATSQEAKVKALGLRVFAEHIVITDRYGHGYGKPHTRGFVELADRSRRRDHIYVGDNPLKDFSGPRSLGWGTLRVRREGGLHHQKPGAGDVDQTVADLTDLHDWLVLRGSRREAVTLTAASRLSNACELPPR